MLVCLSQKRVSLAYVLIVKFLNVFTHVMVSFAGTAVIEQDLITAPCFLAVVLGEGLL